MFPVVQSFSVWILGRIHPEGMAAVEVPRVVDYLVFVRWRLWWFLDISKFVVSDIGQI